MIERHCDLQRGTQRRRRTLLREPLLADFTGLR